MEQKERGWKKKFFPAAAAAAAVACQSYDDDDDDDDVSPAGRHLETRESPPACPPDKGKQQPGLKCCCWGWELSSCRVYTTVWRPKGGGGDEKDA